MPADDDITGADVVIIGGGVVGLAIARAVLSASPALRVVVLDKEPSLGRHASGRNSGVIHAGFYYAPDSLKARLTARGNALLHTFCDEHGVAVRRCGKVVVAQQASDLPQLDALYQRGIDNGIRLEMIDRVALGDLEPLARTVDRAIWSPTTSVADPLAVLGALAADVRGRGGRIRTRAHVQDGRPGRLVVNGQSFPVSHVVNCAGLHADTVASWFGFCDDYVMLPFKGLYWHGRWPAGRMQRNVYPVPDPANPFLGVHLTVTPSGGVKVGPTAIPALWREEYRGMSNFDASEALQSLRQWPGLVRSEHHDARALLRSARPGAAAQRGPEVPSAGPGAAGSRTGALAGSGRFPDPRPARHSGATVVAFAPTPRDGLRRAGRRRQHASAEHRVAGLDHVAGHGGRDRRPAALARRRLMLPGSGRPRGC